MEKPQSPPASDIKKSKRTISRPEIILLITLIVFTICGSIFVFRTWEKSVQAKSEKEKELANTIEIALNGEMVKQLNGVPLDINTKAYHSVKNRLIAIKSQFSEARFIYIYTKKSGNLYFMADSEPENSPDCSPAGQQYTEANEECFQPFIDGKTLITKPDGDRWGNWISVLVPMTNASTGEIFAVLGIDFPAESWNDEAIYSTLLTGIIVLVFLLLFVAQFSILRKNSALRKKAREQEKTEEKLRESEHNFRTFFETIDDMIFISNMLGQIIFTNQSVKDKLGFSSEELSDMYLVDLHLFPNKSDAEHMFFDILAGKRTSCTLPLVRNDKSIMPVETRIWFGKWDGKECIFSIAKDMSKEMEALQKFNKLFDRNPALMSVSTVQDNVFTEVNKTFLDTLGYTSEEIIGKTVRDLDLFADRDKSIETNIHLREKGYIHNTELRIKTKKGEILNGLFSAEIIESQGRQYLLTVMVDITNQKEAEEKALAASKAKSEFLANMSHEIRTPLNAVIGFADLLVQTPLNDAQRQYADNINVSGKALLGIINDILDFSKIEAGRLELDIINVDIAELMEQTTDILKFHADSKGLELLLNVDPEIEKYADVDPVRLKQILINLLNNAVKFTVAGEVELKVAFENLGNNKGRYTFSVRDTGIGISQEQQRRLFKAFSQADSSTTRKFGGTGLGLIISNLLAEKMGSHIQVNSEFGQGSEFSIVIETNFATIDPSVDHCALPVQKVLVIDDNANNRLILEHNFHHWGVEYTGCDSGFCAIALLEKTNFDLVIVDYHMPDMNGIETIKLIREKLQLSSKKLPIIILHSSSDDSFMREECRKLDVAFNLVKPVKASELFQYLKNIRKCTAPIECANEATKATSINTLEKVSKNILIAEDVIANRLLLKTIVCGILPNSKIIEATNGREAVEHAKNVPLDLIFMDLQMPEMDGFSATRIIRESEKDTGHHTTIIALTAGALQEEKDKALASGMDDFMTKPIDQLKLIEVFRKYFEA